MYGAWTAIKKVVSVTNARRKFAKVMDCDIFSVWEEVIRASESERKGV